MLKDLSLKDLLLIRLIAEEGSLTKAASLMHVSQPAASQRLSQLQARLGDELFQRRNGSMQPTVVSKRLAQAGRLIDTELGKAWQDIENHLNNIPAQLRVATQCYTSYRWLPFVLREMHKKFPNLNIDVLPEATESPYAALMEEAIDVALIFNKQSGYAFHEHPLFQDELFAVMHKDHEFARRHYLTPGNFEDQTLVLYTGDKHAIVEEVLKPAAVQPGRLMQVRMTEAIVELVRSGAGIAVLSGWAVDDIEHKEDLKAVRITQSGFIRQWLALTQTPSVPEYTQHFISCLSKVGQLIEQPNWRRTIRRKGSLTL
ncbi:MAG: LysR family transcriptional regulator [Pseudomonadales bacterium]|nr:LysR family transcriptional regulator [Pseudomonadales bacterium]